MSLEKKRETKELEDEKYLEESTFRRIDFKPLGEHLSEGEKIQKEIAVDREDLIEELTEIETEVLKVARSILKLKRYEADFELDVDTEAELQNFPIIEKLYAKCIAKLAYKKGYSKEELFLAIRSLEEKNWIVTNERRTKLEVLNNEKLVTILNFIRDHPGIHGRDERIEAELNITRTPFLKHIMTLERFKLIRSKKIGKSLHYFLADVPEDFDKYKIIFLNPLTYQIIEKLINDESIAISKVGLYLDVYSGTIQYHIKKLKELDIIKSIINKNNEKIHLVNIELLKEYNKFFKEPDFSKLLNSL